jgi:hypothetical protein
VIGRLTLAVVMRYLPVRLWFLESWDMGKVTQNEPDSKVEM